MYICNHCNKTIPDNQVEGRVVKVGPKDNPKFYCMECGDPVVYVPDVSPINGDISGAQATLISNSDNRITTNYYYGATPDEQVETPYGPCRKNEARLCNRCHQWIPLAHFNQEKSICRDCELKQAHESFEEGKRFFEMQLYDNAINCFQRYESICSNEDLSEVKTLLGRCYYEKKEYKQALNYFVVASRNNSESLYYLGLFYYYGYEVLCDGVKAQDLIQEAAQLGQQQAIDFLAKQQAEKQNKALEYKIFYPIKYKGKYGFMDETGKIVIPCQWEEVEQFNEGLAKVKDFNGKWGFVDKTGRIVTPCKWQKAVFFSEGLAMVQNQKGKYGFIDIIGKEVIPCKWERAIRFIEGLACVKDQNGRCGFIDKTGKVVIPCEWKYAIAFKEGLARVEDQNGKYGFIDKTGEFVIPCTWDQVDDFHEGLARVEANFSHHFINKTGEVVLPCQWWLAFSFENGFARVKNREGKWGFIDKTGKKIVPCQWENVYNFNEGLAAVYGQENEHVDIQDNKQNSKRKYGFINITAKAVLSGQWKSALSELVEGHFSDNNQVSNKKSDLGWGFVDSTGKVVIPCQWSGIFYEFHGGLAAVKDQNGKWGYIDKTGKVVIPCRWKEASFFDEGLAKVEDEDGNEFYVDRHGNIIAPRE